MANAVAVNTRPEADISNEPSAEDIRRLRETRVISRSLQKLLVPGPAFRLTQSGDSERGELERFISDKFQDSHGARLSHFLPSLLSIQCGEDYTAALGMNPAKLGRLFLEQYLDRPVEQAIAEICHEPVSRNAIIEIGNLVSRLSGGTALLYLIMLAVIHSSGYRWVMFTATPEVQRSIERMGFKIAPICPADPARLENGAGSWGSYYKSKPQVMVGFVEESIQACKDNSVLESILLLTESTIDQLAEKLASAQ